MSYTIYIDAVVVFFFFLPSALQGFPNDPAADIALNTVKKWIKENPDKVGHVWECILNPSGAQPNLHVASVFEGCVSPVNAADWSRRTQFSCASVSELHLSQLDWLFSLWFVCISN